jgi:hypothetical protein
MKNTKHVLQRRLFWIWLLFLTCSWIIVFDVERCWAADAIVLDVNGNVELHSNNQIIAIQTGQTLQVGDQLKSQGGTATIMFSDGRVVTLASEQTLQITVQAETDHPNNVASKLIKSLEDLMQDTQGPTRKAMVREGARSIPIISPCNTGIFPENIVFQWKPLERLHTLNLAIKSLAPTSSYSLSLTPGSGDFTLSLNKAKLQPGITYYWKLIGSDATGKLYNSRTCWFTILSEEQVSTLQEELQAIELMKDISRKERDFLTAYLYLAYKLYDRGFPILETYPDDQGMQTILRKVQEVD